MIPVLLTKLKTSDGVTLEGIHVKPVRKGKIALIWLHGLGSKFYSNQTMIRGLSTECQKLGIGYFKFNTRGHDLVYWERIAKNSFGGAAFEKFENCIYDIRALIRLAKRNGYRSIILAGHSTGANKALYYLYKTKDRSVKRLLLLGALSDVTVGHEIGWKRLKKALAIARKLKKRSPHLLMPQEWGIYSAGRYLSLYEAGGREDVFPYHNSRAQWKELRSIRVPVAVIIGSRDEHLDRPAKELIEIFRQNAKSAKSFSGIVVKGANHGFIRKEGELTRAILNFIKKYERRGKTIFAGNEKTGKLVPGENRFIPSSALHVRSPAVG